MKLQKQKTHQVGDKQYFKYVIVIKEKLIKALNWKEGDNLEGKEKSGELLIRKA